MIRAVVFDMFETLITHHEAPLYFGAQIAADAGIPPDAFLARWHPTEHDRTIGKQSFEETVTRILQEHQRYSPELLGVIVAKRAWAKKACFEHLHPQILPLLSALKDRGALIGLISNCYSEEVAPIRESILFPYFDACFLSYEQRMRKPDEAIFRNCVNALGVKPQECLYVGDGGSRELEAASALGMKALQATWYFKDGTSHFPRNNAFPQLAHPLDVIRHLDA